MEEDAQASNNNNNALANNYSTETEEEVYDAALLLLHLSYCILDNETRDELRSLMEADPKLENPLVKELDWIIIGECSSEPLKKPLTASDVRNDQARLSLKKEWVENHIIPLLNPGEDLATGIGVTIFDMDGKEFQMTFKTWGSSKMNVLTSGWKAFYKCHSLKANQEVTIGMFRHNYTNKLCFAIKF